MLTDHEDIRHPRRPWRTRPALVHYEDEAHFDPDWRDEQLAATERDRDDVRAKVGRLHAELDRIRRALLAAGEIPEGCRDVPEAVDRALGRLRGAEAGSLRCLNVVRPGQVDADDPWHSASGLPTIRTRKP
jgi:hypothetical protein